MKLNWLSIKAIGGLGLQYIFSVHGYADCFGVFPTQLLALSACNSINPGCQIYSENRNCGAANLVESSCSISIASNGYCGTSYFNEGGGNPPKNLGGNIEGAACVGNPINPGAGNKYEVAVDFEGINGLSLERTYNSGWNYTGYFGRSWTSRLFQSVRKVGSSVVIIRGDGRQFSAYCPELGLCELDKDVDLLFEILADGFLIKTATESERYNAAGQILSISGFGEKFLFFEYSDGSAEDGYILGNDGTPTTAPIPAGFPIRISDRFGRKIEVGFNASGQIVRVISPSGRIYRYSYDEKRNLSSIDYPDGRGRGYLYSESAYTGGINLPYALTGIVDENGGRYATFSYNSSGRAISSEHGDGVDRVVVSYIVNAEGDIQSADVLDPGYKRSSFSFSNILGVSKYTGNFVSCSSGCGFGLSNSFDSNGNVASRTDHNGRVTNIAYDLARNLETFRAEAVGTATERVVTTTWHPDFRLPLTITESGKITTFSYDSNGNLLSTSVTSVPQ